MSQESENQIANLFQQSQRDINHHLETIAYLKKFGRVFKRIIT